MFFDYYKQITNLSVYWIGLRHRRSTLSEGQLIRHAPRICFIISLSRQLGHEARTECYVVYICKVSDIFYFAVANLHHLSLKFLLSAQLVVKLAAMVLRQPMSIAIHESAFALDTQ